MKDNGRSAGLFPLVAFASVKLLFSREAWAARIRLFMRIKQWFLHMRGTSHKPAASLCNTEERTIVMRACCPYAERSYYTFPEGVSSIEDLIAMKAQALGRNTPVGSGQPLTTTSSDE
jgi:hypothetical protein